VKEGDRFWLTMKEFLARIFRSNTTVPNDRLQLRGKKVHPDSRITIRGEDPLKCAKRPCPSVSGGRETQGRTIKEWRTSKQRGKEGGGGQKIVGRGCIRQRAFRERV